MEQMTYFEDGSIQTYDNANWRVMPMHLARRLRFLLADPHVSMFVIRDIITGHKLLLWKGGDGAIHTNFLMAM